jgi:hypothetical protein
VSEAVLTGSFICSIPGLWCQQSTSATGVHGYNSHPHIHHIARALSAAAAAAAVAASIPVVGFNAVLMSEHFGAFLTCVVLHAVFFVSRSREWGGGGGQA